MPRAFEVNFDGLVGPTHNYSGLSWGNLASLKHRLLISHPRRAALEGLGKMKFMMDLGLRQAVIPPHERPHLPTLRRLDFTGSDAQILATTLRDQPNLFMACASSSAMWTANAATVSPSADTGDARVHITPANLISNLHRSIETAQTAMILKRIFPDERFFTHHPPLPAAMTLSDEGAANHMRLGRAHGEPGLEIFTYGRVATDRRFRGPRKFPARQTLEASSTIARLHKLATPALFVQQNPKAIDAGAFHNDVVAVGNLNVLFYHELAYVHGEAKRIAGAFKRRFRTKLHLIEVKDSTIPLADAVSSYLFNSQLVSLPNGAMALIAPAESRDDPVVRRYLDRLLKRDTPIRQVHYVDVRQSMQNGGGPACLRLRVVLTEGQILRAHSGVFLTDALYQRLVQWVERHYREELHAHDLADPKLLDQSRSALDELTRILHLGSIYDFQRG